MKKILFFVINICSILSLYAQSGKGNVKEYGIGIGALGYSGRYSVGAGLGSKVSYNANVFYQQGIGIENLKLRVNAMVGQLKGDNTSFENSGAAAGSFSTQIGELSAQLTYDFINLEQRKLSPYIGTGVNGYALFGYKSSSGKIADKNKMGFSLPIIAGVKYKINRQTKIFLEGNARLFNNNFDNVDVPNNPNKYYSVNVGAIFSLQSKNTKPIW